ncbi:DUF2808 domain-containing protein [Crocosphaera sp. UHCC 0190]|uniref:DUF2808 domain-containing protein n=1 Tax=Crocosphaera sp. UHCC 0190 TaxID=3110246 RepID=UPI002B1E9AD6|nr:DUF2808 domain-containing protein [Crocosphaera sp. UHCC 0190]MEA5510761.1 DUF2808 domain-containing protein [Crocosphaera sp. UHCC 0190]
MNNHKSLVTVLSKRLMAILALSGCLLTGVPTLSWAQSNPGLTIFSGVENRNDILDYKLDFNGRPDFYGERMKLRVPSKKLTQGVSKFYISYLEVPKFDGKLDTDSVDVRVDKESVEIRNVYWDKESRVIEIDLKEPIEPGKKAEIVFSNVKNPSSGTYYFICDVLTSGQIPLRVYIGTWILSFSITN